MPDGSLRDVPPPAARPRPRPSTLALAVPPLCAAALAGGPVTVGVATVAVGAWCAQVAGSPGRALRRLGPLALAFSLLLPFVLAGGTAVARAAVAGAAARGFVLSAALVTASLAAAWPEVLGSLQGLGVPRSILSLVAVALRHVDTLREDASQAWRTLASRGGMDGFTGSWRSLRVLVVHLSIRAFDRADRVADALESRGFAGRFLPPVPRPAGPADRAALGAAAVVLATWIAEVAA